MNIIPTFALIFLLTGGGLAMAQVQPNNHAAHHAESAASAPAASSNMTEGEVRKIDKGAKKITLKHGPIKNLDMPPMTMVFKVINAALLDELSAGDKVLFSAEEQQGAYVVTGIERAIVK
jgi:Cu(I)/Ag(I) efflux system protein CusF